MSKNPEAPTTLPEPSSRVDTPKADLSEGSRATSAQSSSDTKGRSTDKPSRSKKINWEKVRVFDKPEYRLPFKLSKYTAGKKGRGYDPEPWLQAAIESGLVEMGSLAGGKVVGEFLEPIGRHPPARMKPEKLEAMLLKGISDILEKK